eukprot:scaffold98861_cov18-Tisochrysis_lutea.AAC.2
MTAGVRYDSDKHFSEGFNKECRRKLVVPEAFLFFGLESACEHIIHQAVLQCMRDPAAKAGGTTEAG